MANTAFKKPGVLIGCRDVVFAKMKEDIATGTTYDTDIRSAPGVIEIALTSQNTNESLGADDIALYETMASLDGFEVSITLASLGADGQAFLLGSTVDQNGVLVEGAADNPPYVAMGFKTARSDGTDDYVWLYKGRFVQGDATFRTKEQGTVNWQTPVLTGTFLPRVSDKAMRATVNSADTASQAILESFFNAVYEKTSAAE